MMAKPLKLVKPKPMDVLRLGAQAASLKASMPPKRWKKYVKAAHKQGYTVRAQASGGPNALKERTPSSLRKEAQKTVAATYAPARKELSTREAAIGHLDQKRAADDASYRNWLTGETEKLDAQARAADTALASQQQAISDGNETAMAAAKQDSLQRMGAVAGNVSDPKTSTALDTTAADQRSRDSIADRRSLTADLTKIGEDARGMSRASLIAQQSAREAGRQADTYKAMAEVSTDREKLVLEQAANAATMVQSLMADNVAKVKSNREFNLAAGELGQKQDDLAADIAEANRKFRLEEKKFSLDAWVKKNAVLADRAKLQLGYDQIKARKGEKAADQAMRVWVEKYKARQRASEGDKDRAAKGKKKGGIKQTERDLYSDVQSAQGLITRMHADWNAKKPGAIAPGDQRQHLRSKYGLGDLLIDVAVDANRHPGLSSAGRAKARKLGITHVGYFFK